MKLSTLIHEAKLVLEEHGDLDVHVVHKLPAFEAQTAFVQQELFVSTAQGENVPDFLIVVT